MKCVESFFLTSSSSIELVPRVGSVEADLEDPLPLFLLLLNFMLSLCGLKDSCSSDKSMKACWGERLERWTWFWVVPMFEMFDAIVETAGW